MLFNGGSAGLASYRFEGQDAGTAAPSADGTGVTLRGSAWKVLETPIDISADTVLDLDFACEQDGEVLGIGFVKNGRILESHVFQLTGSQDWGIQDARLADMAPGRETGVSIDVGRHFTGEFDGIAFIADDDAHASAVAHFSDLHFIG
jgi:hypothetical protein